MIQLLTEKGVRIIFNGDGSVSIKGDPAWTRTIRTALRLQRTEKGFPFNPLRSTPDEFRRALTIAGIKFTSYGAK